jgi:3,4-dihydroxy 2-butanone 4-phosphate synthase / GTP cyclohydrolase II
MQLGLEARMVLNGVDRALEALRRGRPVVVVDDADRENEGDLILAAEHATEQSVAFLLEYTSGFLCAAVSGKRATELRLPAMVDDNTEAHRTAFLVSVDVRHGTTTGISAADRAATARALADPATVPTDLARPGHVLPLLARPGGVLERRGHTEAAVDLVRLAGLRPAALLGEIVTPDRRGMMRDPALTAFAAEHGLPILSIADLVAFRHQRTSRVERLGEATIPIEGTEFRAICYRSEPDGPEHMALVLGDVADGGDVLTRIHSECLTGDVFESQRCDCRAQLSSSLELIRTRGRGVVVYLRGHEGRGIGLGQKLRAYELQQRCGLDTVDANLALGLPVDVRDYTTGAHVLRDLGVRKVRLITNNPDKQAAMADAGVVVVDRVALDAAVNASNITYLRTKKDRMGHTIDLRPREGAAPTALSRTP